MIKLALRLVAVAVAVVAIGFAAPAFAQDTVPAPTTLRDLVAYALPILFSALGLPLGGILIPILLRVWDFVAAKRAQEQLKHDDAVRVDIDRTIDNGIGHVAAVKSLTDVGSLASHASEIADYVESQIPQRLDHFKMNRDQLKQKVVAAIGKRLLARTLS